MNISFCPISLYWSSGLLQLGSKSLFLVASEHLLCLCIVYYQDFGDLLQRNVYFLALFLITVACSPGCLSVHQYFNSLHYFLFTVKASTLSQLPYSIYIHSHYALFPLVPCPPSPLRPPFAGSPLPEHSPRPPFSSYRAEQSLKSGCEPSNEAFFFFRVV